MRKIVSKVKTLIKKLGATGFMNLFGSSVINKILTFISGIIIVRLIPKSDYGVYSNANNILSLFCLLEGFSATSVLLQFGCTKQGKDKEDTIRFCYSLALITNTILSIIILFSGAFIKFSIDGTGKLLMLMSFQPLIRTLIEQQRTYLRIEQKNKEFAFANNLYTVTSVILTIILSFLFKVNGLILSSYLTVIIITLFLWEKYNLNAPKLSFCLLKNDTYKMLKFAAVCVINNSTGSIMYLLDTFVLGIVIAESTVTASYKVATTIPTALAFIPSCVMVYIYPYFAKRSKDVRWCIKNYKKVLFLFGTFNLAIVAVLVVFAPLIIKLMFGAQYLDALIPCRILCVSYFVRATFRTVPGQLLVTQEKLGFNTFVGFASSALNTILNIVLIPKYSSNGAAMATLIVTIVFAVMSSTYLYMVYKKQLNNSVVLNERDEYLE